MPKKSCGCNRKLGYLVCHTKKGFVHHKSQKCKKGKAKKPKQIFKMPGIPDFPSTG